MRLRSWLTVVAILAYFLSIGLWPRFDYEVPPPATGTRLLEDNPAWWNDSALLLSGGGYRAMLFHIGSLWRLNEAGLLPKISVISSVSGGAIAAAIVGFKWKDLAFDPDTGVATNFEAEVVTPARRLAGRTIDLRAMVHSLLPWSSPGQGVMAAYRANLFGRATLRDLPDRPYVLINATNLQSQVPWTFAKYYMQDRYVGWIGDPTVELAAAVAASSAFPPFLSPFILKVDPSYYRPPELPTELHLQREPFTTRVFLADGGVFDNLAFMPEGTFKVVIISDGTLQVLPEEEPPTDWLRQTLRVLDIVHAQPSSLRLRTFVDQQLKEGRATYSWSTRTSLAHAPPGYILAAPSEVTKQLAAVPTRLAALPDALQKQLINFGYAAADVELSTVHRYPDFSPEQHRAVNPYELNSPSGWPYPECALTSAVCD